MNNASNLFENLMLMHESDNEFGRKKVVKENKESMKKIDENDTTLLNLTVEIPTDKEEIKPDDVKVDVGVMPIETEDNTDSDEETDEINVDEESGEETGEEDVTPEDEGENEEETSEEEPEKEESLKFIKESTEDDKQEIANVIENILYDWYNNDEENEGDCEWYYWDYAYDTIMDKNGGDGILCDDLYNKVCDKLGYNIEDKISYDDYVDLTYNVLNDMNVHKLYTYKRRYGESLNKKCKCTGKEDCECESCKAKKEATDVDSAKKRIIARVNSEDEGLVDGISNAIGDGVSDVANAVFGSKDESIKTESLMHLDATSLNKLITNFVKDNYKNIDKVIINKAMLENNKLTLTGFIRNTDGLKEAITLSNKGFDPVKLENKRFLIDFADTSDTFGVMKESVNRPFVFTASLVNNNLKFESLKYNFKTRIDENRIAKVHGDCILTEDVKPVKEDANQVAKFNEISDKIKAAKTSNDLLACKDEMDKSNVGDTLKSALQMIWDDVNNKIKNQ